MTKTVYLSGLKYIDCELLRVSNKRELGCLLVFLSFSEAYKFSFNLLRLIEE